LRHLPKQESRWHKYYRPKRLKLIREFGGHCTYDTCNSTSDLEFGHVRRTSLSGKGRGSYRRLMDVMKNFHAYKLMCRRCHRIYDIENHLIHIERPQRGIHYA